MSAELLRRAADSMRRRAEDAAPSPWVATVWPKEIPGVYSQTIEDTREFDPEVARTLDKPDAAHIASWHPAVALEAAELLDVIAEDVGTSSLAFKYAERFARAYLGKSA